MPTDVNKCVCKNCEYKEVLVLVLRNIMCPIRAITNSLRNSLEACEKLKNEIIENVPFLEKEKHADR